MALVVFETPVNSMVASIAENTSDQLAVYGESPDVGVVDNDQAEQRGGHDEGCLDWKRVVERSEELYLVV